MIQEEKEEREGKPEKKQLHNNMIESANQPAQNYDDSRKIIIKSIEGPNDMNFTITTQGM